MGLRILIIDGDPRTRQAFADVLEHDGHAVRHGADAMAARAALAAEAADLIVLDIGAPGTPGWVLARELADAGEVEIIALAPASSPQLRIAAFDSGIDDYLEAPVDALELAARIRARARRRQPVYHVADLLLDQARRIVVDAGGAEIVLSRGEFEILAQLAAASGKVVSREVLSRAISRVEESDPRSVDALVSRLRKKLHPRDLIVTSPGFGYRLRDHSSI